MRANLKSSFSFPPYQNFLDYNFNSGEPFCKEAKFSLGDVFMAITIRVFKRLENNQPVDEVSYDGAFTNPAYFSVAVIPLSGENYAPDEEGLTLYVKLESPQGEKGLDLKVKAEPKETNNPPPAVLDGFQAWCPFDSSNGQWLECYTKFRTVSIPGQELPPDSVISVKLRVAAQPGDPPGKWQALLHFLVYNIGT